MVARVGNMKRGIARPKRKISVNGKPRLLGELSANLEHPVIRHLARRAMIKRSLLAVVTSLLPGCVSAASRASREVLTFYYGWYGDPNDNPDWRGVDTKRRVIANAPEYPTAGPYSSQDPAIIQRQVQQMKAAGITGLIYSWWGIHTYEDNHFAMVIRAAQKAGLKVTVYYEKCASTDHVPNVEAVIQDFEYIMSAYCQASNWLTADGKKVL